VDLGSALLGNLVVGLLLIALLLVLTAALTLLLRLLSAVDVGEAGNAELVVLDGARLGAAHELQTDGESGAVVSQLVGHDVE